MIETTTNHDYSGGRLLARNSPSNMLGNGATSFADPNVAVVATKDAPVTGLAAGESAVHRTLGATFLSSFNLFLKVGINFVLLPLTLKHLGREQYGIWIALQSFPTYLALSEMGIG